MAFALAANVWVAGMSPDMEMLRHVFHGVAFTFSKNCCSGIVHALGPRFKCQCWRCREKRGLPVTKATEAYAALRSQQAQKAFRAQVLSKL